MLTLTADQLTEIRTLCGTYVRTEELTDAQINGITINGAASDYVVEEVIESIDFSKFTAYNNTADARNATIDNFVRDALNAVQQNQFRRAVMYRCSGIAVGLLAPTTSEGSNDIITQRRDVPRWQDVQTLRYEQADAEIRRLRASFPSDAFLEESQTGQGIAAYSFVDLH